jgi:hypothetical protein
MKVLQESYRPSRIMIPLESIDLSEKKDFQNLLEKEDVKLETKLSSLKFMLMQNKIDILVKIEKFLINILHEDTLSTYQKLRLIDDFSSRRNAMMRYKTVEWVHNTVIELYWILFKMNIDIESKIQCLNFLLRSDIQYHRKIEAVNELQTIATNGRNTMPVNRLANLVDLLMHSGITTPEIINDLMATLRAREAQMYTTDLQDGIRHPPNVYGDSQNVHDSDINNSIKDFLDLLAKDVHNNEYKYDILHKNPVELIDEIEVVLAENGFKDSAIKNSLDRISTDFAKFSNKNQFRLRDILQRVWNRIMNCIPLNIQKDLLQRLSEELVEMSGTCSTGHMSRIVNVLSGYTEDLKITISWQKQISANIIARLNKRMQADESGDIVNAMIETDETARLPYTQFLVSNKVEIHTELLQEYELVFDKKEHTIVLTKEMFTNIFENSYPK